LPDAPELPDQEGGGGSVRFGTPLSEQAKAELKEAREQVEQAVKALKEGLLPDQGNIQAIGVIETARNQCLQAISSLEYIRGMHSGDDYYRKEAELGVHRVREAITNLKDVLRMLEVPE